MAFEYVKAFSIIYKYVPQWSWYEIYVGYKRKIISKDEVLLYAIWVMDINKDDEKLLTELFITEDVESFFNSIIESAKNYNYNNAISKWIFAIIYASYKENRENIYGVIELLYADFDYPDEISGLVPYMPKQDNATLEEKLEIYVTNKKNELRLVSAHNDLVSL